MERALQRIGAHDRRLQRKKGHRIDRRIVDRKIGYSVLPDHPARLNERIAVQRERMPHRIHDHFSGDGRSGIARPKRRKLLKKLSAEPDRLPNQKRPVRILDDIVINLEAPIKRKARNEQKKDGGGSYSHGKRMVVGCLRATESVRQGG